MVELFTGRKRFLCESMDFICSHWSGVLDFLTRGLTLKAFGSGPQGIRKPLARA